MKKLSKYDALTCSVARSYAHWSTEDITREHTVLACALNAVSKEIVALSARLTDARDRHAKIEANIAGLMRVVDKR